MGHPVTIIVGATGSGKTTQLPQFLYQEGFGWEESGLPGKIGVTQPRRVAAVAVSKRVAEELNAPDHVAYQIRHDSQVQASTRIKFMTDGVLLREIQHDFLLRKYSAVVLDEAHERNINTDILIGLLSRIVKLRAAMAGEQEGVTPLKIVIMSATLRVADFIANTRLFPTPPPVVEVPARQYPVKIHFNRRTPLDDWFEQALTKLYKIHAMLPAGHVLVFLTGRAEIEIMCRRVREHFEHPTRKLRVWTKPDVGPDGFLPETPTAKPVAKSEPKVVDEAGFCDSSGDQASDAFCDSGSEAQSDHLPEDHIMDSDDDGDDDSDAPGGRRGYAPVHVLPLYSMLEPEQQARVFEPVPEGSRLIVVATNVAETSITIPSIRYVLDCGREKQKRFDATTGMSSLDVGWISKASAQQRAGRAGRTGPGHVYRLFSGTAYESEFPDHTEPEIMRVPLESTVLHMKNMNLQDVSSFPFPTPPDPEGVASALATRTLR